MNRFERSVNVCFHGIGTPQRDLEPGEAAYWVSKSQFEHVLDEITAWPGLAISFDDSNKSDIEIGLPALRERGLTAKFFILAGRIHDRGSLGQSDIHALVESGMTIGSHGMDHRPWRGLDPVTRRREFEEARAIIENLAQVPVEEAALPLGRYDRTTLAQLKKLKYRRIHTSDRRLARPDAWIQPRFSVRATDEPAGLREQIKGAGRPINHLKLAAVGSAKRLR